MKTNAMDVATLWILNKKKLFDTAPSLAISISETKINSRNNKILRYHATRKENKHSFWDNTLDKLLLSNAKIKFILLAFTLLNAVYLESGAQQI